MSVPGASAPVEGVHRCRTAPSPHDPDPRIVALTAIGYWAYASRETLAQMLETLLG